MKKNFKAGLSLIMVCFVYLALSLACVSMPEDYKYSYSSNSLNSSSSYSSSGFTEGTYRGSGPYASGYYSFSGGRWTSYFSGIKSNSGTYTINGNTLTLTVTEGLTGLKMILTIKDSYTLVDSVEGSVWKR